MLDDSLWCYGKFVVIHYVIFLYTHDDKHLSVIFIAQFTTINDGFLINVRGLGGGVGHKFV